MGKALAASGGKPPRFVMFFKGGAFIPRTTNPASLQNLAGTALAPLQGFANDIVLFKNMHTHGGEPKADGYQEEHAAGLYGCVTGNRYRYSGEDAYYAYTDHESIDIRIANHYKSIPELKHLAFPSLHIGAGAHSDADDVGLGIRHISFRNRQAGDARYGNAIVPIQNAGQLYSQLISRVNGICSAQSLKPGSDASALREQLFRKKSVVDFVLEDIAKAKRLFGMDSEHSRKLDGLADGWRETEKQVQAEAKSNPGSGNTRPCPSLTAMKGNGTGMENLDELSPVHDQMILLMKLAFEWDLTRVVAYTASGASSGQNWPSKGIHNGRHSLEHAGNESAMLKLDAFYSEKFAKLLSSLKEIDDGDGKSALFNSSIILGMECWSSGGHYLTNIPYVLAGQGGGRFKTGQIINAQGRSNNDLLISCLQASGIQTNKFGIESLCRGPIL